MAPHRAVTSQLASLRAAGRASARALALAVAVAVLVWALTRTYPNYDSYYHLVWGRELLDGLAPSFEAYAAPTQHPLYVALGALLGLVFGESADRVLVLVCLLSHAALVFGTYRLGAAVFGRWSGALAALFVAASASFLLYAARGYVDAPFLALVVWAGVLAASRAARGGRRRCSSLAGLLRPEAWVLTGLWWLWHVAARRVRGRPIVGRRRAGCIWALTDLIVTGDPLHSLHATSRARRRSRARARACSTCPGRSSRSSARPCGRRSRCSRRSASCSRGGCLGWRRCAVPLALFAAGVITFVGTGALGLSILPRYLTVPAIALCLFAGYALLGFTDAGARASGRCGCGARARRRRPWSARSACSSSRRR